MEHKMGSALWEVSTFMPIIRKNNAFRNKNHDELY